MADGFWVVVLLVWGGWYLLSCAYRPYRICPSPWCSARKPKDGDGSGNYRLRVICPVCKGLPHRRMGARLIGRG